MPEITPTCHNKPFRQMTDHELREELAYWEGKIKEASGWGSALGAAVEFAKEIKQILGARASQSEGTLK